MFRARLLCPEVPSCVLKASLLFPHEIRALAQPEEVVNLVLVTVEPPLGSWMASAHMVVAGGRARPSGFIVDPISVPSGEQPGVLIYNRQQWF